MIPSPCVSYVELRADCRLIGFRVFATDASGIRTMSPLVSDWLSASVTLTYEPDRVGCHGCYRGIAGG